MVITTAFTARSTALEVVAGVDLTGRTAVVTGAASGIGVETARAPAAAAPQLEGVGGHYFEDCLEAEVTDEIRNGIHGVRAYAPDPEAAQRLWDVSVTLLEKAGWDSAA